MARAKLTGWGAALESIARHERRQAQPRDRFGRFKLRETIPLTAREQREIPKQRELAREEIRRLKRKPRPLTIPEVAEAQGVEEAITIARELGVHPDSWARDVAYEFDLETSALYDEFFGYSAGDAF